MLLCRSSCDAREVIYEDLRCSVADISIVTLQCGYCDVIHT